MMSARFLPRHIAAEYVRLGLIGALVVVATLVGCDKMPVAPISGHLDSQGSEATGGQVSISREPQIAYRIPNAAELAAHVGLLGLRSPEGARFSVTSSSSLIGGDQFQNFIRYPVETRRWQAMASDIAYFRDVHVGGATTITSPGDGDQWTAEADLPDGTTIRWGAITFRAVYNGEENCFVTASWRLCDADFLYVDWYRSVLCSETGIWRMRFYRNGGLFHQGTFRVLARIEQSRLPLFNQGAYPVPYDHICKDASGKSYRCQQAATETPQTIAGKGCAMTAAVMMLNYHGINVDPPALNTWLKARPDGYVGKGMVNWSSVIDYAREVGGRKMSYLGNPTTVQLKDLICKYGPQVIPVKNGTHFVLATGWDDERQTFVINDPAGGIPTSLLDQSRYNNTFGGIRAFSAAPAAGQDQPAMFITHHSPVQAFVTDPLGRRVGFDARTGQSFAEIPEAYADSSRIDDAEDASAPPDDYTKEIYIANPLDGEYTVTVVGTRSGTYLTTISTYGVDRSIMKGFLEFPDVPVAPGIVHGYQFSYSQTATSALKIQGAYNGGGQSPAVNTLLSYIAPFARSTSLPVGTSQYTVMIVYAQGIDPATFVATLNGQDASARFNPVPDRMEVVALPLVQGRNVLKLSATGTVRGRRGSDHDSFVFVVP